MAPHSAIMDQVFTIPQFADSDMSAQEELFDAVSVLPELGVFSSGMVEKFLHVLPCPRVACEVDSRISMVNARMCPSVTDGDGRNDDARVAEP